MSRYTIYYSSRKDMYIKLATRWKAWADARSLEADQVRGMALFFRHVGTRFGLLTEFKAIGVI